MNRLGGSDYFLVDVKMGVKIKKKKVRVCRSDFFISKFIL